MSKKTLYLLGILLTILIGTYFYWKICCNGGLDNVVVTDDTTEEVTTNVDDTIEPVTTQEATSNAFALNDASGSFAFSSTDNFNFDVSGFSVLEPISAELNGGIDQLKAYLDGNATKSVDITGFYSADENNASAYPDLGLARANAVKNYFAGKGIPSARMNTFGNLWDDMFPDGTIYKGPVAFGITTADDQGETAAAEELRKLGESIKANPLVLQFAHGKNTIDLSTEQRQKIADIARYLDKVETAKAIVEGHTDNSGSGITNTRLGLRRANFAKDYLVSNGIPATRIDTSSKGSDEPVASNATKAGKAQNRRTVVTIN